MLLPIISNIFSILLFFSLLCCSAADRNPFVNEEHKPDIFWGLPGSDGYGSMGARPTQIDDDFPNEYVMTTEMPLNAQTGAANAPGVEGDRGGMSALAPSVSSSRSPQEFYCPQDNNAKFSTGGKCFELHCNSATNLRVGVAQQFPSTSLKQCAEACGQNSQCVACDIHLPGARQPNTCLLFRGTPPNGRLTTDRFIHYWVMLSLDQCGSTYDDRDRDRDRDRYLMDRECAIDREVVSSAEDDCYRQYGRARPTPLFNSRGRPVCCGPVKNYDRDGRVVESCPPSRSDARDNGGYDDGNYDDGMGAQNMGAQDVGGGGGAQQQRMN